MNSLSELKDFLVDKQIQIKEFNGWFLKIGKDTWTMVNGCFYKNGTPQSIKDKKLFDTYIKVKQNVEHQSNQTRKWRGISSRNIK